MALTQVNQSGIADDSVDIAQIKAGSDGQLISFDASGNPVKILAGTSGHFLKSQGDASQPVFAAAPTGVGGAAGADFNDDVKLRFGHDAGDGGATSKGEIYFDETNDKFRIAMATGSSLPIELTAQNIYLQGVAGAAYSAKFSVQSGQELYYSAAKKFETTTGGIGVTGAVSSIGATDLTLNTNAGTDSGSIVITDAANGDITITPNGTGDVVIDGLKYPQADGSANQVLKTNGSAQLSWTTPSAGAALTGSTNNTVVTVTGADAMQGEANLTFDGSTLTTTGDATFSGNVSIGGTTPNAFSNYKVLTIQGGSGGAGLDLEMDDGNIYGRVFGDPNGLQIQSTQAGDYIRFETAGANERMRIDANGAITKPAQPSASVYMSGSDAGGSGGMISAAYAVPGGTRWNIGSHYSTSTGKFTCPVAGKYQVTFVANLSVGNLDAGQSFNIQLKKNGGVICHNYDMASGYAYQAHSWAHTISCAANDYLQLYYTSHDSETIGADAGDTWNDLTFTLIL